MKPTQEEYKKVIERQWKGFTAQEICSILGKKLNNNTYKGLEELTEIENYEIYEARHKQNYFRKVYRKRLPRFEFGYLGISLLIILWVRNDWMSIEELYEILDKEIRCDILELIDKLEDLKDCGFIVEENKELFFRMKVLK